MAANRLKGEKSPYLRQHAENPVDWYPWCEKALERARREDKPLFVSVGYSTCHWCHVMERESFEDPDTARIMNSNYINIKVDREERPDIDRLYMKAVQAMTGHGGWPLNVFSTPEGRPFYGGTYFPPEDRYGMPSFRKVLLAVSDAYRGRKSEIKEVTAGVEDTLRRLAEEEGRVNVGPALSESGVEAAEALFDPVWGGFGPGPKFPQAMFLRFLLKYHMRTGDKGVLDMVELSLKGMAAGGIHDHLGGGFHRYSVDSRWEVPHFEKMLYDNVLLLILYSEAFRLTGKPLYREAAGGIARFLARDMKRPGGGFAAALDADSPGGEGVYYTWTPEEIDEALGSEAGRFMEYYSVTDEGNYEGRNTLRVSRGLKDLKGFDPDLAGAREKLLKTRSGRPAPGRDDKVIAGWNAIAVTALVRAGAALGDHTLAGPARECLDFISRELRDGKGRLARYWLDGRADALAGLEDHALTGTALVELGEATGEGRFIREADAVAVEMLKLFSGEGSLLFDTGADQQSLFVRERSLHDTDLPSGNSASAEFLLALGRATGNDEYENRALEILSAVEGIGLDPVGHGHFLCVLEDHMGGGMKVRAP